MTETPDDVVARLRAAWLHHWRPDPADGAGPDGACVSLEIVDLCVRDHGDAPRVFITARVLGWDDKGALCDVKEQEVYFGALDDYDDAARDAAAAAAYGAVIVEVLGHLRGSMVTMAEGLMPADLVCGDLAGLGNCEAQPQFERALRTKKRLGRFLR